MHKLSRSNVHTKQLIVFFAKDMLMIVDLQPILQKLQIKVVTVNSHLFYHLGGSGQARPEPKQV